MSEAPTADYDAPAEYVVRQDDDIAWWLSLHQCPTCFALVVEDFMPEHQAWHAHIEAVTDVIPPDVPTILDQPPRPRP